MPDILRKFLQDKNILILGFGREGQATYGLLRKLFPGIPLTIADQDILLAEKFPALRADTNLSFRIGQDYLQHLQEFDLIIKSPGISPQLFPLRLPEEKLTSQTELFLRAFREQVIGVTGTKGKSTTSSLIAHLLKKKYKDVVLAGNIGIPPFELLASIGPETLIVYEMSSHQLEQTRISPHIAVLLNLFEEHLDHYEDYEAYQEAKLKIARFQHAQDWLVYVDDNLLLRQHISRNVFNARRIPVSLHQRSPDGYWSDQQVIYRAEGKEAEKVVSIAKELPLQGDHNLLNMMAALAVCKVLGVENPLLEAGLYDFRPLAHRMEYVGKYKGIQFYNDSIATIPEATLAAIDALKEVDTLILGGKDRGIDYTALAAALPGKGIRNLIFMGEAGERIRQLLMLQAHSMALYTAANFEEVVALAVAKTARGKICLLSPAAASYDWFRNFEERGMVFRQLLKDYPADSL